MVNNTGQEWRIISADDGELLTTVYNGESISIRSAKQVENDKYYSKKVRIKGGFIKVMKDEKNVVNALMNYPATYLALNVMKRHLEYNTNLLVKEDGSKYKGVDLAEEMGITRQSAMLHFKRLKEHNLIAEVEMKRGKYWAINPCYYLYGDSVIERVLKAFDIKYKKSQQTIEEE